MADSERSFIFLTGGGVADPGQADKLAAVAARLAKPGARLLLHLHGGLVDEAAGVDGATRLAGRTASSWNCDDDWTQVYIVWRTGLVEQVGTNWPDLVRDDRLYQLLLSKLIRFVARKIGIPSPTGARSLGASFDLDEATVRRRILGIGTAAERHEPFAEIEPHFSADTPDGARSSILTSQSDGVLADEFRGELLADPAFSATIADIDAALNEGVEGRAFGGAGDAARGWAMYRGFSAETRAEIGPVDTLAERTARGAVSVGLLIAEHAARIALRCFKRFRSQRDHGFHATLVEEVCRELYADVVGAKIWGMMTRDAREHFEAGGFGSEFLSMLQGVAAPDRFVVSGHSAGSIWASHMLLAMKAAGMTHRIKLVLLAPAVRQDMFADVVTKAGDLVEACTMLTMSDALERADALLGPDRGYIYPSSLLYAVSGMFEERVGKAYIDAPILGMLRFTNASWLAADEQADFATIAGFFKADGNKIIIAPAAGICEASCHGCFDDEPTTLATAAAFFSS